MGKKTVEQKLVSVGKQIGYLKSEIKGLRTDIATIKQVLKDAHIMSLDA